MKQETVEETDRGPGSRGTVVQAGIAGAREGRARAVFVNTLGRAEDLIYALVGILLAIAAVILTVDAATSTFSELTHSVGATSVVITLLDKGLVMFMVAELLHTVRITIRQHILAAEPFLIVGLIAGIRRVLVLTAESTQQTSAQEVELGILVALILVMSVAILMWRRSGYAVEDKPEQG